MASDPLAVEAAARERVAEALYNRHHGDKGSWDEAWPNVKTYWLSLADAAYEASRGEEARQGMCPHCGEPGIADTRCYCEGAKAAREEARQEDGERIGRRDFNAGCEDRPGVSVGEDLMDKLATWGAKCDRLETALAARPVIPERETDAKHPADCECRYCLYGVTRFVSSSPDEKTVLESIRADANHLTAVPHSMMLETRIEETIKVCRRIVASVDSLLAPVKR